MNLSNCKRAFKYLMLALITGILVRYIPKIMISNENIFIISSLVSVSYVLLDRISP